MFSQRKNCKIDELLCCFDVKVLVCKAVKMFKAWWSKNDERTTNDERRTNELIGPNFWLVRIFDWSEFQLIGTNSDRLVRIPNDWFESRTIGPNSERLARIPNDWSEFRTIGRKMLKCWRPKKKSAWTDLDRVSFKKFVKESNVEIEKSAWTGLDKVKKWPLQR